MYSCNEAPAVDVGRQATAAVHEVNSLVRGVQHHNATAATAAINKNPGNAERDVHRLFIKFGLTLGVPIHFFESTCYADQKVTVPMLRISDMLRVVLTKYSAAILAGHSWPDAQCSSFLESHWELYRRIHPDHPVFAVHGAHLGQVVPVISHGDSGRTLKKSPIEIFNIHTPFGQSGNRKGTKRKPANATSDGQANDNENPATKRQKLEEVRANNYGNSLGTRLLVFVLQRSVMKVFPELLSELFAVVAQELADLFHVGLIICGQTVYFATMGMAGDMEWHTKCANLNRDWNHIGVNCGICPYCLAGYTGYAAETTSLRPSWLSTMFQRKPWDTEPCWSIIPFDQDKPEKFYLSDCFHIIKVGLGRNFVAGAVWLLCVLGYFPGDGGESVAVKLARAYSNCSFWCKMHGKSLWLRGFTKENFHQPRLRTYGFVGCKGSDTMILMQWIAWFAALHKHTPLDPTHVPILECLSAACHAVIRFFRVLYKQPLWVKPEIAKSVFSDGLIFLKAYHWLATRSFELEVASFKMVPKFHAWHHVLLTIQQQLDDGVPAVLNPLFSLCEMDEDFVGVVSRTSRRVSGKTCHIRTIQRILVAAKFQLEKFKR